MIEIPTEIFKKIPLNGVLVMLWMALKIFFSDSDTLSFMSMKSKSEDVYKVIGEDIADSQSTEFYEYSDSEK